MYREYGRSEKGKKIIEKISGKKYKRVSVVAGKQSNKIIAPMTYENTMTSGLFEKWFEEMLLNEIEQESLIVMDNAAFHRKAALEKIVSKTSHRLIFLPPYSPDLNPIENYWAYLKATLRKILYMFSDFYDALNYILCL